MIIEDKRYCNECMAPTHSKRNYCGECIEQYEQRDYGDLCRTRRIPHCPYNAIKGSHYCEYHGG